MAENIKMEDMSREDTRALEETPEEGETRFDDNLLDPNRGIQIIDTSVPNARRDVGVFKRAYTQDKKDFLRDNLDIRLNKNDGPSSTLLFDSIELTMSADLNGMRFKGTKIIVYKD